MTSWLQVVTVKNVDFFTQLGSQLALLHEFTRRSG